MSKRLAGARTFHRPDGVEIHVTIRVPMGGSSYVPWTPAQIQALFDGVGNLLQAQPADSFEQDIAAALDYSLWLCEGTESDRQCRAIAIQLAPRIAAALHTVIDRLNFANDSLVASGVKPHDDAGAHEAKAAILAALHGRDA